MMTLTRIPCRVYALPVAGHTVTGNSSPEFRRSNRALLSAVFSCAAHGGSYGPTVRGESQDSPVPEPGLLPAHCRPPSRLADAGVGFQPSSGARYV